MSPVLTQRPLEAGRWPAVFTFNLISGISDFFWLPERPFLRFYPLMMVGSSKSSGNIVLKWFKQCLDAGLLQLHLHQSCYWLAAIILTSCEILLQLFPVCQSFFQPVVVAFSNFFLYALLQSNSKWANTFNEMGKHLIFYFCPSENQTWALHIITFCFCLRFTGKKCHCSQKLECSSSQSSSQPASHRSVSLWCTQDESH